MTGGETIQTYLLDSNILIEAHRRYYSFDICAGFWHCLLHHHGNNKRLLSIDRVKDELQGKDELCRWVKKAPQTFFPSTGYKVIAESYGKIMEWVHGQSQFLSAAKAEFARGADGWLIAYAMINDCMLVTHEVYDANVQKKVKIPNVCRAFDVKIINTFDMLRELDVHFHW